jgi:hypothetical protein
MSTTTLNIFTPTGSLLGSLRQAFASRLRFTTKAPTRVEEAAEVRELARRLQATDHGFAADLFAAADRHENAAR